MGTQGKRPAESNSDAHILWNIILWDFYLKEVEFPNLVHGNTQFIKNKTKQKFKVLTQQSYLLKT